MERSEVFDAWAPPDGRWTPWAKPVLFAQVDKVLGASPPVPAWVHEELFVVHERAADYRSSARPPASAVVVDLPGAEGVATGLALARCGFRPVPLYTALGAAGAVVPMFDVVRALVAGADELGRTPLPPDAPPAFLVDSRRAGEGLEVRGEMFDNRSILFDTDVPSARRLREGGVGAVVLVQSGASVPRADLARVLVAWQGGGLRLALVRADAPDVAAPLRVRKPGLGTAIALWWKRAFLRGNPRDGFGKYGFMAETHQGG